MLVTLQQSNLAKALVDISYQALIFRFLHNDIIQFLLIVHVVVRRSGSDME